MHNSNAVAQPGRGAGTLLLIILLSLFIIPLKGQSQRFPGPDGADYDFKSVKSGNWSSNATWGTPPGVIPNNGADVQIRSGHTVYVNQEFSTAHNLVHVDGNLKFRTHRNTRLITESIFIDTNASFEIGTQATPVEAGKTATIVFKPYGSSIGKPWDPEQKSLGLISKGTVTIYGEEKSHWALINNDIPKEIKTVNVGAGQSAPSNWNSGDTLVIAGTQFRRGEAPSDELARLTNSNGNLITLNSNTTEHHLRASGQELLHIANLTRNVVIKSEGPELAHIMLMNHDVDINYATFRNMGRTDKSRPLDDFKFEVFGPTNNPTSYTLSEGDSTNIRGRYALHFHRNGMGPDHNNPRSKVVGCVVWDAVGWGFVNHSSDVRFEKNVAYNFKGAGFVTEAGDEVGEFIENIAIRGTGEDQDGDGVPDLKVGSTTERRYYDIRQVFRNKERPQPLGDFGFAGDGFWFQGPAIKAIDNVASSCNGAGMIWFGAGAVDPAGVVDQNGNLVFGEEDYTGFPVDSILPVYHGYIDPYDTPISNLSVRTWNNNYTRGKGVIGDLPILKMDGFLGYGSLVGFKVRFTNHKNFSLYSENPFNYQDNNLSGNLNSLASMVKNVTTFNCEWGIRARYASNYKFETTRILNKLRYDDELHPYIGAELWHSTQNLEFENSYIQGYPLSAWTFSQANEDQNIPDQITWSGSLVTLDYVRHKKRYGDPGCARVNNVTIPTLAPNGATVSWPAHSSQITYLIRFQKKGDIQWTYVNTTSSPHFLSNLAPETKYDVQVIGGCTHDVRKWSDVVSFETPPFNTTNPPWNPKKTGGSASPTSSPLSQISLFPNPIMEGQIKLDLSNSTNPELLHSRIIKLEIRDGLGRLISSPDPWMAINRGIPVESLESGGTYLLRIFTDDEVRNLRFVKIE